MDIKYNEDGSKKMIKLTKRNVFWAVLCSETIALVLPGGCGDDVALVGGERAAEDSEVVAGERVLGRVARSSQQTTFNSNSNSVIFVQLNAQGTEMNLNTNCSIDVAH